MWEHGEPVEAAADRPSRALIALGVLLIVFGLVLAIALRFA